MKSYVIMGRDASYTLAGQPTIHSYHEARLENEIVVSEQLWYEGKPVPGQTGLLQGQNARHLRSMGFRTWQIGCGENWRNDATLIKIRAALKLAETITGLLPFLTNQEYLHLCDVICCHEGHDQVDFRQYPVSQLGFLFQ